MTKQMSRAEKKDEFRTQISEYVNEKKIEYMNDIQELQYQITELLYKVDGSEEINKEMEIAVLSLGNKKKDIARLEAEAREYNNLIEPLTLKDIKLDGYYDGYKKQLKTVLKMLFEELDECMCLDEGLEWKHEYCENNPEINECACEYYEAREAKYRKYPFLRYSLHNKHCHMISTMIRNYGIKYLFFVRDYKLCLNIDGELHAWLSYNREYQRDYTFLEKRREELEEKGIAWDYYDACRIDFYHHF